MKLSFCPKKLRLLTIAVTLFVLAFHVAGQAPTPWSQNNSPLPPPTGFVNDYAGVIDVATKQQLKDTTKPSVEIGVAVLKTTGDRDIFDYSLAVARGWKIGSKEDDNPSALLFIAIDDRKYFTQVSKDLEDELPDGVVGSLQRQYLVPEFKKGNYGKGISDTIDTYIATIRNKGNAPVTRSTPTTGTSGNNDTSFGVGVFCCAGIFLIILVIIFARNNRGGPDSKDKSRWGGGPFGGGGGGGVTSALPWIIGGILSGGGGSSSSSSSDWGGSSGGGFGGFGGGGDFGGGGSGGSW
jgi:uncharacterized protein